MSKDLITTIIGFVGAAVVAADTYMKSQTTGEFGLSFIIGLAGAVLIALFGYWSKKGE